MNAHDHDRLPPGSDAALQQLAQHGASGARPGDPAEVRRLGHRRGVRRRQRVGAVAAVLVLALGAGTLVVTLQDQGLTPSPPVSSTSAAPSPAPSQQREVRDDDVVQARDLPRPQADGSWTDEAPADPASVCQAGSWESLGATSVAANGLRRLLPAPGETEQPLSTAVALQLPDAEAAEQAAATIRDWVDQCPERLVDEGEQIPENREVTWNEAPTAVGSASWAEVVHAPAGLDLATDGGFWESVGVVVVGDRVAVTVDVFGPVNEYLTEVDAAGSAETGLPLHPQLAMTAAAALRLDDQQPPPGETDGGQSPDPSQDPSTEPPSSDDPSTDDPSTDDPSTETPGNEGPLTEAMVPQLADFEWSDEVTFTDLTTYPDEGQSTVIACQQDRLTSLGTDDIRVVEVQGDVSATAAVMSFPDTATAEDAWATLQGWADGCTDFLAAEDLEVLSEAQDIPVEVSQGEARYLTVTLAAENPEEGQFVDVGMSRVDNRIVVAGMGSIGTDHNFDTEPGGPVGTVYPMIRTLQNLNQRLAG